MTITHFVPTFGAKSGGTEVTIYGTFTPDILLYCRFDNKDSQTKYINRNEVRCVTPPRYEKGPSTISISNNGADFSFAVEKFMFYTDFSLKSIHPSFGDTRGGTTVSVLGQGFSRDMGPVHCLFGEEESTAEIISETFLECISPPLSRQTEVEFSITHGSDYYFLPDTSFAYDEVINLLQLYPETMPSNAANYFTIYGVNFRDVPDICCRISYSNMTLPAHYVSSAEVRCKIPDGLEPKVYFLTVANNCQDFSPSSLQLEVTKPSQVSSILPYQGFQHGGTSISVFGKNFSNVTTLRCIFDDKFLVQALFINSKLLQCTTPAHINTGVVALDLILDGKITTTGYTLNYTYIDLSIQSIYPPLGGFSGGTSVTVHLRSGKASDVSHCRFGDILVQASYSFSRQLGNEVICVSPSFARNGRDNWVSLEVSMNGVDFTESNTRFVYIAVSQVYRMSPVSGPETGGTTVSFRHLHFSLK